MAMKATLELVQALVTILGVLCGGGYFLWRVRRGDLTVNLSLTVTPELVLPPAAGEPTRVTVSIVLERGESGGALEVHQCVVRVRGADGKIVAAKDLASNFARWESKKHPSTGWFQLSSGLGLDTSAPSVEASRPRLALVCNERMQVATHFEVASSRCWVVEVLVLGNHGGRSAQWQSSAIVANASASAA